MEKALKTKRFGRKVYNYKVVSSTNEVAKVKAKEGAEEGTVVTAQSQTKGKGRSGKSWESPIGTSISMSIILRPIIEVKKVSSITLIAGLAVCKAIRKATNLEAYIKWPNDIVINRKKVCGILTEMRVKGNNLDYIVVGIGVNVNSTNFPDEINDIATSLKLEGGKDYKTDEIICNILRIFEYYYEDFIRNQSISNLVDEYKSLCISLKNELLIMDTKAPYRAFPVDIDNTGALIVDRIDGERETIKFGEVSVRGVYGYV